MTKTRVYVDTAGQHGYPAAHHAGVTALDRETGRPTWRFVVEPGQSGAFGFPGSPAIGAGLVFAAGLDGRILVFAQ